MNTKTNHTNGFTIVELLIVIVVIGILAAIVIASFNGVSQRAKNTSTISTAKQIITMFNAYTVLNDVNPAVAAGSPYNSGGFCLTVDNVCSDYNGTAVTTNNAAIVTELRKMGTPPTKGPPAVPGNYKGVYFDYNAVRTYNGQSAPYLIMYWLQGVNQKCTLANTVESSGPDVAGVSNPFKTSTTGWTDTNFNGLKMTECWVSVS